MNCYSEEFTVPRIQDALVRFVHDNDTLPGRSSAKTFHASSSSNMQLRDVWSTATSDREQLRRIES